VCICYNNLHEPRNNLHDAFGLDHSWYAIAVRERLDNGFVSADSASGQHVQLVDHSEPNGCFVVVNNGSKPNDHIPDRCSRTANSCCDYNGSGNRSEWSKQSLLGYIHSEPCDQPGSSSQHCCRCANRSMP
jgi:hypothetical protein